MKTQKIPRNAVNAIASVALLAVGFAIPYGMGVAQFVLGLTTWISLATDQNAVLMWIAVAVVLLAALIIPVALYREISNLIRLMDVAPLPEDEA